MIALLLSFLIGALPFAVWLSRLAGVDPRRDGSGNPGATNVHRLAGPLWGGAVLLLDAGKGALAVALFSEQTVWVGLAVVCGHLFSPLLRFRGGKGVATSAGVALYAAPIAASIGLAGFVLVYLVGRRVAAASLLAWALFVGWLIWRGPELWLPPAVAIGLALLWSHRHNLRRMRDGTEPPTPL